MTAPEDPDNHPVEQKKPFGYCPAPALFLLDQACIVVGWAFDSTPYLVGSSLTTRTYRDVDVRVILDDEVYDRWFPGPGHQSTHPLWSLLCSAISSQLASTTGLPIDFQLQSRSDMEAKYANKPRHPLGIFPTGATT